MVKLRLNLVYDYEIDPEDYFDEPPAEITDDVLREIVAIETDPENIRDFLNYIISTEDYEGSIEVVE